MTTKKRQPPRLYCIAATSAPVALVFRRGPSRWFHLLRWMYAEGRLEPGVWVHKRLYPRSCDLSDDGELMSYFLAGIFEGRYMAVTGVSRMPWLHPLASWSAFAKSGNGLCFGDQGAPFTYGEPSTIRVSDRAVSVVFNDGEPLVNERRRGWIPVENGFRQSPFCTTGNNRDMILEKRCDPHGGILRLTKGYGTDPGGDGVQPSYELRLGEHSHEFLADAAWADWGQGGLLLMATNGGELRVEEIRGSERVLRWQRDLGALTPCPVPPPTWACSLELPRPE